MVCVLLAIPLTGVGFVFSFPDILDGRSAVVCVLLAIPLPGVGFVVSFPPGVGFVVSFPGIARKRNGLEYPENEIDKTSLIIKLV